MSTQDPNEKLVISYLTMRKAVGWLGMLLPFILIIGNSTINSLDILNNDWFVITDCQPPYDAEASFKSSISHYYYTTVGELFTGTLSAVALFMFCYKGHPKRQGEKGLSDSLMTNLAGAFSLGVVIFPTSADDCIADNIRTFLSSGHTGTIHFIFAALFFVTLAFMSIINFRRSDTVANFGRGNNARLYLWCGLVMLASLVIIFIYAKFLAGRWPWLDDLQPVFVLEALALLAFGLSWLSKGKVDFAYVPKMLMGRK
jgi:magnesium-transporting ATPase (P-type)